MVNSCCVAGFIPARAGNTFQPGKVARASSVYPRSRGEHRRTHFNACGDAGLSPLARGTLVNVYQRLWVRRFIPARAGNTCEDFYRIKKIPVYPRSRGEHRRPTNFFNRWNGLSPLARGTLRRYRAPFRETRFIPARAGNTAHHLGVENNWPVYPRSRGEHWQSVR